MQISDYTKQHIEEEGYESLDEYLRQLSDDFGIPLSHVVQLAELLGEDELFDGLVVACEDAGDDCCY